MGPQDRGPPVFDQESEEKHMTADTPKPFTPRPNERMFQSTDMVRKKVRFALLLSIVCVFRASCILALKPSVAVER